MLHEIERSFDLAFVTADQNLKLINQILSYDDFTQLADDSFAQLNKCVLSIANQLCTMTFHFGQLMCRTLLLSENHFILKERFKKQHVENFHLKSDKSFMNFVRKLNQICLISPSSCRKFSSTKPKKTKRKIQVRKVGKKSTVSVESLKHNANSLQKVFENDDNRFKKSNQVQNFEQNFIHNFDQSRKTFLLKNCQLFKVHNTDAFRWLYKSFKETELINHLKIENLNLQNEIVNVNSELTTNRLLVKYLNNQLSGRIQQIQLLIRKKRDEIFDQVWSDLESEISINKFKYLIQTFQKNSEKHYKNDNANVVVKSFLGSSPFINQLELSSDSNNHQQDSQKLNTIDSNQEFIDKITKNSIDDNQRRNDNFLDNPNDSLLEQDIQKRLPKSWFNVGFVRFIFVDLQQEALGISIIGGKEYGLPIMISEVHQGSMAHRTKAFKPGDLILTVNLIDVTNFTHDQAASILKNLSGKCRFGVFNVKLDQFLEDDNNHYCDENGDDNTVINQTSSTNNIIVDNNIGDDTAQCSMSCIDGRKTLMVVQNSIETHQKKTPSPPPSSSSDKVFDLINLNYYRSILNSTLISKFDFSSSSSSSSSSSDNDNNDQDDDFSGNVLSSSTSFNRDFHSDDSKHSDQTIDVSIKFLDKSIDNFYDETIVKQKPFPGMAKLIIFD